MANLKNADGTVNFEGMRNHLNYVKGKYAQNAKNYKENTGKEMGFGAEDEGVQGSMAAGQSAGPNPNVTESEAPDARAEGGDAPDASQHDERKND